MTTAATPLLVQRARLLAVAVAMLLSAQHCGGRAVEPPALPEATGGSREAGTSDNGVDASAMTGQGGSAGLGGMRAGGGAELGGAPQTGGSGLNDGSTAAGGSSSTGGSNANGGSQ